MIKSYLIICSYGDQSGFGHLTRAKIIKNYIKKNIRSKVTLVPINDRHIKKKNISELILKKIYKKKINVLILDLNYFHIKSKNNIIKLLNFIKEKGIKIVGVDSLRNFYKFIDCAWIPSSFRQKNLTSKNIVHGFDKMIFNRYKISYSRQKKIAFLVGGSNDKEIPNKLPRIIEKNIPKKFKLTWIMHGFANQPKVIDKKRWVIYNNKNNLESIFKHSGFIFSFYGLSFFESLNCGIPTVAFCTKKNFKKDYKEIIFLKKKKIFFIETNINKAVRKLADLISNKKMSQFVAVKSKKYLNKYNFSFLKKI